MLFNSLRGRDTLQFQGLNGGAAECLVDLLHLQLLSGLVWRRYFIYIYIYISEGLEDKTSGLGDLRPF